MAAIPTLKHEFVRAIPDKVEEGKLYISIDYATAVHKCCCGCGREVVTPLSPTDWKVTFDGVSVSLFPSIGNWGFECRSHYWIDGNLIKWADQWSDEQIAAGRARDRNAKANYYTGQKSAITSSLAHTKKRFDLGSWLRSLWPF